MIDVALNETAVVQGIITSHSNGPMELELETTLPPENGAMDFPATLHIPYTSPATDTLPFTLKYTRDASGTDEIEFTITGTSTQDPDHELKPSRMELRMQEPKHNLAEQLPSPAPWLLLVAFLGIMRSLGKKRAPTRTTQDRSDHGSRR